MQTIRANVCGALEICFPDEDSYAIPIADVKRGEGAIMVDGSAKKWKKTANE